MNERDDEFLQGAEVKVEDFMYLGSLVLNNREGGKEVV